jgi:hypothetical protein
MIEIERESAVPSEPYANLTPIVDFLHHEGYAGRASSF